jgi:peptidoglycan/LPS O-acetylase OafA/YrhL
MSTSANAQGQATQASSGRVLGAAEKEDGIVSQGATDHRATPNQINPATGRHGARRDIQGLRCIAVLSVVCNHLTGWPSGGFVGVDIFFVISGYLITGLLVREHWRTGRISFGGFYGRRIKRVVPSALLVLGVTVFASWLLLGWSRTKSTAVDALWSALFAGNWRFLREGTDYFALGQQLSPLQHYWSLGVEEQFYFVWPGLLVLIFAALGTSRPPRAYVIAAGLTVAVVSAASLYWALERTGSNPAGAYFSSLTRAWELGVGALLAISADVVRRHTPVTRGVLLSWVGCAVILASLFIVPESPGFPAPWAALPVLATALVIAAGENVRDDRALPLLSNPLSVYIGDISYSLYLWHFPVIILLITIYPADSFTYYLASVALISAMSVLSYHLFENPIRRSPWLTQSRRREPTQRASATRFQATAVAFLAIATTAMWGRAFNVDEPAGTGELPAINSSGATQAPCLGAASLLRAQNCDPDLGEGTYPLVADLAKDDEVAYACFSDEGKEVRSCKYGRPDASTRVAVVGDSHAAALLMPLRREAERLRWSITTYLGVGCRWNAEAAKLKICPSMGAIQRDLLSSDYDIVITSAYRKSGNPDKQAEAASLAQLWRPVAARGAKIVAVEDVPFVGDQLKCLYRVGFDVTENRCSVSAKDGYAVEDALKPAVKLVPGAVYLDTSKFFCAGVRCPLSIGHVLVYRDEISHVSDTYAETLSPFLADAIARSVSSGS